MPPSRRLFSVLHLCACLEVTGNDEQTAAALAAGAVAALKPLLMHAKKGIRKEGQPTAPRTCQFTAQRNDLLGSIAGLMASR